MLRERLALFSADRRAAETPLDLLREACRQGLRPIEPAHSSRQRESCLRLGPTPACTTSSRATTPLVPKGPCRARAHCGSGLQEREVGADIQFSEGFVSIDSPISAVRPGCHLYKRTPSARTVFV